MSCGRLWRLPDVRKARCHAAHSELYAMLVQPLSSVNPPEAHQRRTAERLHAVWHTLETGHYPMLSAPEALMELLVA